jgi:hypothetical protein
MKFEKMMFYLRELFGGFPTKGNQLHLSLNVALQLYGLATILEIVISLIAAGARKFKQSRHAG